MRHPRLIREAQQLGTLNLLHVLDGRAAVLALVDVEGVVDEGACVGVVHAVYLLSVVSDIKNAVRSGVT